MRNPYRFTRFGFVFHTIFSCFPRLRSLISAFLQEFMIFFCLLCVVMVLKNSVLRIPSYECIATVGEHQLAGLRLNYSCVYLQEPVGVEYDPQRNQLIVADASTSRVSMHDLKTGQCGGEFRPPRECPPLRPLDIAVDQRGLWYVSDSDRHCIYIFEKNGEFVGKFGNGCGSGENQFNHPWGICFDREDNLLIADTGNNRIVMYRMSQGGLGTGTFVRVVTEDVHAPKGLSINAHQNLVLVDGNANNFVKHIQI